MISLANRLLERRFRGGLIDGGSSGSGIDSGSEVEIIGARGGKDSFSRSRSVNASKISEAAISSSV